MSSNAKEKFLKRRAKREAEIAAIAAENAKDAVAKLPLKSKKTTYLGKRGGKLVNLMKINKGILLSRRGLTFTYKSYYSISLPALQKSITKFISLVSLLDPEYDNLGRNDTMGYYNKYMGATAGLYTKYKPYSATFEIKAIPTTADTLPMVVYSATDVGTSDYTTSTSCYKIAERPGAKNVMLEYLGDTKYKSTKFKLYHNQVFGVTREQYKNDSAYAKAYNTASSDGPWLAISIGDSTGADTAQTVTFQVTMKLRTIIFDPVPVQP